MIEASSIFEVFINGIRCMFEFPLLRHTYLPSDDVWYIINPRLSSTDSHSPCDNSIKYSLWYVLKIQVNKYQLTNILSRLSNGNASLFAKRRLFMGWLVRWASDISNPLSVREGVARAVRVLDYVEMSKKNNTRTVLTSTVIHSTSRWPVRTFIMEDWLWNSSFPPLQSNGYCGSWVQ